MSIDDQKRVASQFAADLVEDGMTVGLGSGSTAEVAVQALGARVQRGLKIVGVASSDRTARLAGALGIPLTTLEQCSALDLCIDGADEFDARLNLVKGRGGALLREKIVALSARRFVVVVDETKQVRRIGEHAPVPIEVVPFGWTTTQKRLHDLGVIGVRRGGDDPFFTDNHNYILDCHANEGVDLARPETGLTIKAQTGVVEHGLFLGVATLVVMGHSAGVELFDRDKISGRA